MVGLALKLRMISSFYLINASYSPLENKSPIVIVMVNTALVGIRKNVTLGNYQLWL